VQAAKPITPTVQPMASATNLLPSPSAADAYPSAAACNEFPPLPVCSRKFFLGRWADRIKAEYLGNPDLFCERPFRATVRAQIDAHISRGVADQLALYHYDFQSTASDLSHELNPFGRAKLQRLMPLLNAFGHSLVIEPSDSAARDESRRQYVLELLALWNSPVEPARIVIAVPMARGLSGVEALAIHGQLMNRFSSPLTSFGSEGESGTAVPLPIAAPPTAR
jgi:hypothetical protein